MEALEEALSLPDAYPGGFYWVNGSPENMLPAVKQLLEKAAAAGVITSIVKVPTFDELAADIVRDIIDLPNIMLQHVMDARKEASPSAVYQPTTTARKYPVLRFSALMIEQLPSAARRIQLEKPATTATIRELLKAANVQAIAACNGREVAAFGNDQKLLEALASLGPELAGTTLLNPEQDSWAMGLLYDALVRALSRRRPLRHRLRNAGHSILVVSERPNETPEQALERSRNLSSLKQAYDSPLAGKVPNLKYPYSEGINIRLDRFEDRWWCGFEPFTFVDVPSEQGQTNTPSKPNVRLLGRGDPAGDWRRERWARKYNDKWADIIDAWAKLLVPQTDVSLNSLGVPSKEGIDACFRLSPVTAWSRPAHHHPYFERTQ
jgi:hypothetical protein